MANPFGDIFRQYANNTSKDDAGIFEEEPVPLDVFLYDRKFLNIGILLSDIQFDVVRHSTQIYRHSELITLGWNIVRDVNEIYLQWGKGSGKDLISMLTAARIAYLLMCLRDPQGYFGMPVFANIDMVNMAYNSDQAKFNFYEPMRKMIMRSHIFKGRAECMDRYIKFDKNIYAHSGHSDEDSAEGKSLILAVLDEISAFKTKQEFSTAAQKVRAPRYSYEALIDAMKSSRQSRFDTGKLIAISYPRYKGCPIQQLYNSGLDDNAKNGENSRVYVSFGKTWDVNPMKKWSQFEAEFKKNPALVRSKYMCDPQQAEDAYIKRNDIIDETFRDIPEVDIPHWFVNNYPVLKVRTRSKHDFACSIHIDLGLNNCRAGFAMTHMYDVKYEKFINPDTGAEDQLELPIVGIDILTSFQAQEGHEIDFSEIRKFIFSLRSVGYHIGIISYDQWNSAGERQILEKAGFNVVRRSVDLDKSMYDDLVIMMTEKRLTGGYADYRPYTFAGQLMKTCVIKEELANLVELRGKKIDHRPGGSKDESDALAGSVRGAIEFGIWRCGASKPASTTIETPDRAFNNQNGELGIVTRLKAAAGMNTAPDNVGYRGTP